MKQLLLIAAIIGLMASCKTETNVYVQYPEKEVTLNTKRIIYDVQKGVLAAAKGINSKTSNIPSPTLLPDYSHDIPTKFDVYFKAKDGQEQGQIIKKLLGLSEGSHSVKVPARNYDVIITNYPDIESKSELRRNFLPETSDVLYMYGTSAIDYSKVDNGEVTVTNDYSAALVLKNEFVKSVPSVNGKQFFDTPNYYVLYMRDQNGNKFTRDIQLKVLKKDGGIGDYNLTNEYDPNKVYRFVIQRYNETDGNLNIIVDKDILKETKDKVVIPNL